MASFQVYNNALKRRYFATSACSLACCVCLLTWIIAILLPLFLAILTDNFWTRNFIIYEQPALTYQQKLIVFFQGYRYDPNSDSRNAFELAWTTSQDVNDRLGDTAQRIPQVRTSWEDTNLDNVPDVNHLSVAMPLQFEEQIHSVTVFAFYHFRLRDERRLEMDGMLSASVSNPLPGLSTRVSADLDFQQRARLSVGGGVVRPFEKEFAPLDRNTKIEDIRPHNLVSRYTRRNFTISLNQPAVSTWEAETSYDPGQGADSAGLSDSVRYFQFDMDVRSSTIPIWTRPSIIFMFKQAWIQYLSIFVIVYGILMWLNKIIYSESIVHTRRADDIPRGLKQKSF